MNTTQRGKWGEEQALTFLVKKGFIPVKRNFRSRFGEIDLIMKNDEFIIFVEVKVRKNANFAHAREFVSYRKQEKIRTTANFWLSGKEYTSRFKTDINNELQPRFDVIEIYAQDEYSVPQINHIENAF